MKTPNSRMPSKDRNFKRTNEVLMTNGNWLNIPGERIGNCKKTVVLQNSGILDSRLLQTNQVDVGLV